MMCITKGGVGVGCFNGVEILLSRVLFLFVVVAASPVAAQVEIPRSIVAAGGEINTRGGSDGGTLLGRGDEDTLGMISIGNIDVEMTVAANSVMGGTDRGPVSPVGEWGEWDTEAPTLTIRNMPPKINSRAAFVVHLTFDRNVSGFTIDDVTVTGASKDRWEGGDNRNNFALHVLPDGEEDVVVSVLANSATDAESNSGPVSAVSRTSVWDASVPMLTIDVDGPGHITNTDPITMTFTFSADVMEFDIGDVSVVGGTKGTFTAVSAKIYTLEVTPDRGATVRVNVGPRVATDGNSRTPVFGVGRSVNWEPTVTITGVPDKINSTNPFTATFTFSEDVTGFETGDLTVAGGSKGVFTATNAMTYTLVVTPAGNSNVGIFVARGSFVYNNFPLPRTTVTATAFWDAVVPTLTITGLPDKINTRDLLTATFTFNEDVTGFVTEDVTVTGGAKGTFTATNARTYTLEITPSGTADVEVSVPADAATDGVNDGPVSAVTATAVWDAVVPTLTITGLPDKINTRTLLTATFTFSEDVTGFEATDITVTGGAKGTFSGSGAEYTLGITPDDGEDVVVSVPADAATDGVNDGPVSAVTATAVWDAVVPTLTITGLPDKINGRDLLTVTFTFNEDVTGFVTEDVTVTGGAKGTFSGSGAEYTLGITPDDGEDVVVSVPADAATDGVNDGPVSAVTATAVWDAVVPTLTITGLPDKINGRDLLTVTFTFSEDVTGFEAADVTVSGGSKGAFTTTNARTYTLAVTPSGNADVEVSVPANAATDGVNDGPVSAVTATAVWDAVVPTLTITGLPDKINGRDLLTATFTFNENVTGFVTEDVTVTGGAKGTFSGSSAEYTLGITPDDGEDVVVSVPADAATDGVNDGPVSAVTATAVWDAVVPTLTITGLPDKINGRDLLTVMFIFSEDVTGFEAADVTVSGGSKGAFTTTNARTYTLAVTPSGNADVEVSVPANVATDGANQTPASRVSATAVWDAAVPTLTITGLPDKINGRDLLTVMFTFSEDVTGFEAADVTVSGGSKGAFTTTNVRTYTLAVTPSGNADVEVSVPANVATDGANQTPASRVSATAVWDAAVPTLTITGVPSRINSTSAFTATFTFNEDVTGFEAADVAVSGGSKGAFTATNARTYMLPITPSGNADIVVSVAAELATDGINLAPASAVEARAVWDSVVPILAITDVPAKINTRAAFTATLRFSGDVTGFAAEDVTVSGGSKGTFSATNAQTYTLAITPAGNADVVVNVAAEVATDGINLAPTSSVEAIAIWDTEAPTLAITGLPGKINGRDLLTATFTFSEDVTGFVTGDVTVTGGSKGTFTATGPRSYALGVTPAGNENVVVSVEAEVTTDGINLGPVSRVSATALWDAGAPTVAITDVPARINTGDVFTATFTFSEAVTGFETGDVTVTGGTKGVFTGSGTTYSLGITPVAGSDIMIEVAANSVTDGLNSGPISAVTATAIWGAVSVTVADAVATEGDALMFTVTLDERVSGGLMVTPNFTDSTATKGTDYTENTAALTFTGTAGETQTFTVATIEDELVEADEIFMVGLTVSGTTEVVEATDTGTGTITDDDGESLPAVSFASQSVSVQEDAGTVNVMVQVNPVSSSEFMLNYQITGTATESEDYNMVRSVSVTANTASVNIPVVINDDHEDEKDETVIVTLTRSIGYAVGSVQVYTLTIQDNDATVVLSASPNPVSEGEAVEVMATLSQTISREVRIPLVLSSATAEVGDYGELDSIVVDKNEWSGTGTIVTMKDSDLNDETFTVALGGLPPGILAGTPASVEVTITDAGEMTSAESLGDEIPTVVLLAQNYPNPFNPTTAIEFSLDKTQRVTLMVYDILGQEVQTLVDGVQSAGRHSILFVGSGLASDTYIYVLQTEGQRAVKMMTLLK